LFPRKIDLPLYEITLPSNGRKIKFRPYVVKEDMILQLAAESKEGDEILLATKQIVTNCVQEETFNVQKLPMVDFDYIFVNLRARSVGQDLKISLTCLNKLPLMTPDGVATEESCNTDFEITYDLEDVSIVRPEQSKNSRIMLGGTTGLEMKLPNFDLLERLGGVEDPVDRELKIIEGCISKVFDKDSVVSLESGDSTPAEIRQWIENLSVQQFNKIKDYIENLPYLRLAFSGKCPRCNHEHKFDERKLLDFF
jgi:hypothetical protein